MSEVQDEPPELAPPIGRILIISPSEPPLRIIDGTFPGVRFFDMEGQELKLVPGPPISRPVHPLRALLRTIRETFEADTDTLEDAGFDAPAQFLADLQAIEDKPDNELAQALVDAANENPEGGGEEGCSRLGRLLGLCH
jgi:hypothetical protein